MTLRHMHIFCAVCNNNCSTTKAAQQLNITQPAVSLVIKELEQYYGILLFDRIRNRLKITEAGLHLLEYASRIDSIFQEMELHLRDWSKSGIVRIGASMSIGGYLLPQYVKCFQERHPDAIIKVKIAPSDKLEQMILSSELDFAFIEGIVHHPDIVFSDFLNDHLEIICAQNSAYSSETPLTHAEFQTANLLLREPGSATRELFDHVTEIADIHIVPLWESASTIALINATIENLGISVLPHRMIKEALNTQQIRLLTVKDLSFQRTLKFIHHKDKRLTPVFMDFIKIAKDFSENADLLPDKLPSCFG